MPFLRLLNGPEFPAPIPIVWARTGWAHGKERIISNGSKSSIAHRRVVVRSKCGLRVSAEGSQEEEADRSHRMPDDTQRCQGRRARQSGRQIQRPLLLRQLSCGLRQTLQEGAGSQDQSRDEARKEG